jgi:hypothetical protein
MEKNQKSLAMNRQKQAKIIDDLDLYFIDCEAIMAATCSDDEQQWLTAFYKQLIKETTDSEEYSLIAKSVIKYLDDKNWAKKIYTQAIKEANDADDYCELASSIFNVLHDKTWAEKIYNQAIDELEAVYEYCSIASSIMDDLGDKSKTRKLYTTAMEQIEDTDDCCMIAKAVVKQLDDKEWAAKLYQQAIDMAGSCDDCITVAIAVAEVLDCKPWAKAIIDALLEDRNNIAMNYRELAEVIIEIFDDDDWAKNILTEAYKILSVSMAASQAITIAVDDKKLECAPNGTMLFLHFAETVASLSKDYQWAIKILLEVVETAQTIADYCAAGDVAINNLSATSLAVKLYQTAYEKITNLNELIEVTAAVSGDLGDAYWGRELANEAIAKCETAQHYCRIAEVITNYTGLNDKKWADEIFKTALDCAKTEAEREAVGKFINQLKENEIPF